MRWTVLVLALSCGGVACGKKTTQKRAGDAAPVEVVTSVNLPDASAGTAADEVEPNDSEDVATPLPLEGSVHGRIDPEADVDTYTLEVTQAGALAIDVQTPEGVDLTVELEDAAGSLIAKSDRGGAKVREGIPNAGVTPGRYLAIVRGKKVVVPGKKPAKPPRSAKGKTGAPPVDAGVPAPAPAYEISVHFAVPTGNAEREPDGDRGTANDLIVGDAVSGFVGWSGDDDVWKLSVETLSAKNAIDVEVSAVEGVALTLEIADGIGRPLIARKGPRGAPLVVRGLVPVVPDGAPPFHYVTVGGDRSNPETPYQLKVTSKGLVTDGELEPNDAPDKAMAMPADRTVVHGTWSPGDVDCYAVAVDQAARTLDATIVGQGSSDADLAGELFVDGKSVAKANKGGKGVAEKVGAPVPAGAQAVVCVRGSDASPEGAYDVQLQEGPAAP